MIAENTLTGLGFFAQEIIHLISIEKVESIEDIEKHFDNNDVVEYFYQKYRQDFSVNFDNSTYDNSEINKYFNNYEDRKYRIVNERGGLLLILAIIAELIEPICRNMSADK